MTHICVACGGIHFEDAVVAYDRFAARPEDYVYQRCRVCSLLVRWPMPEADEIPGLYPADYPPHRSGRPERVRSGRRARRFRDRIVNRHLYSTDRSRGSRSARALLAPFAPMLRRGVQLPRGGNRLLDVGCGTGELMARHRELGWEVRGVEPSEIGAAACRAAGLSVLQEPLLEADLPEASFDVVVLNHVIEHLLQPLETLVRARCLLAPGGLLEIVTPNVRGMGFRLYGSCWYSLDAPRHIHLFSASALARLGRKAGLVVDRVSTRSSARVLSESRRYLHTQGPTLPDGLSARSAVLARSRESQPEAGGLRRVPRPLASSFAFVGRGENLRGRFLRDRA
jgi:2-polyprenyl-3-methyl-5-hydroxy-6-metoxy-1,4-benzoquinol methylase